MVYQAFFMVSKSCPLKSVSNEVEVTKLKYNKYKMINLWDQNENCFKKRVCKFREMAIGIFPYVCLNMKSQGVTYL